jgi:hypothetical protein
VIRKLASERTVANCVAHLTSRATRVDRRDHSRKAHGIVSAGPPDEVQQQNRIQANCLLFSSDLTANILKVNDLLKRWGFRQTGALAMPEHNLLYCTHTSTFSEQPAPTRSKMYRLPTDDATTFNGESWVAIGAAHHLLEAVRQFSETWIFCQAAVRPRHAN